MKRQILDIMVEHGCATCNNNEYRYAYIEEKDGKRCVYHRRKSASVFIEDGWEDTDKPHKGLCIGITRCICAAEITSRNHLTKVIEESKEWCYKSVLIAVCDKECQTEGKVQMLVDNQLIEKGFLYITAYIPIINSSIIK